MSNDLFSWPGPRAKARASNPRTSLEAADSIKPDRIRESQTHILGVLLMLGPHTDEEIYQRLTTMPNVKISPSGARTRRKELVDMRRVMDSGERRLTASGRKTIVWRIVT